MREASENTMTQYSAAMLDVSSMMDVFEHALTESLAEGWQSLANADYSGKSCRQVIHA